MNGNSLVSRMGSAMIIETDGANGTDLSRHLISRVTVQYVADPNIKFRKEVGWGPPVEITNRASVEFGAMYYGQRNALSRFTISVGVFNKVRLESTQFGMRSFPRAETDMLSVILRSSFKTDSIERECDYIPFSVGQPIRFDLRGETWKWISLSVATESAEVEVRWTGDEANDDWWLSYDWMKSNMSRYGMNYFGCSCSGDS